MTTILGIYTRWNAIQVSDRLVSVNRRPGSPNDMHDMAANKTLVFYGRRGIVTIGMAGLAYIGGKPLDVWVAEELSGQRILGQQASLLTGKSRPFDIGQAIEHLRRRLEEEYPRQSPSARKHVTELQVVGMQWDRRKLRIRPVICLITNAHSSTVEFRIYAGPRHWDVRRSYCLVSSGNGGRAAERYAHEQFSNGDGLKSADRCVDLMTEAVRHAASIYPDTVGADCMCIRIRPDRPRVLVEFRSKPGRLFRVQADDGSYVHSIAFTPFVVGPNMVAAPSISTGDMFFATPEVDIKFSGGSSQSSTGEGSLITHWPHIKPPR